MGRYFGEEGAFWQGAEEIFERLLVLLRGVKIGEVGGGAFGCWF